MPIQPVSGEIKAQPLNDNFSYLESKTSNISKGAPSGTYASVAALRAAYPSGNTNIYVVTDDGNWYFWNGSQWTSGGKYQEKGIADKSIDGFKIKTKQVVSNRIDIAGMEIPLTYEFSTVEPVSGGIVNNRLYSNITSNPSSDYIGKIDISKYSNIEWAVFKGDASVLLGWSSSGTFPNGLTSYQEKYYWAIRKKDNSNFSTEEFTSYSNCIYYISDRTVGNFETFTKQLEENTNVAVAPIELAMAETLSPESYFYEAISPIAPGNFFQKVYLSDEIPKGNRISVIVYSKYDSFPLGVVNELFSLRERDAGNTILTSAHLKHIGRGIFIGEIGAVSSGYQNLQILLDNRRGTEALDVLSVRINLNSKYIGLPTNIGGGQITKYVSPSGLDTNTGDSVNSPLKTFQKAIDSGAEVIKAERGKYFGQSLKYRNKGKISVIPSNKANYEIGVSDDVKKIEIINGDFFQGTKDGNLFKIGFSGNTRFENVFLDQSLQPDTGGDRPSYNCGLWQLHSQNKDSVRLRPVLTLNECKNSAGTFFWDGDTVTVNIFSKGSALEGFLIHNDIDVGLDIQDCDEVILEDVSVKYSYSINYRLWNIRNLSVRNCEAGYTMLGDGFSVNDTNGTFIDCISRFARNDGFNMHNFGDTHFSFCEGHYNGDDGISHHDGCTGSINGGEWSFNCKGGISSPCYGSIVQINDNYCHDNKFGLYAIETINHPERIFRLFNNVLIDNSDYDIQVAGPYSILGKGNKYLSISDPSKYKNIG